MSPRAAGFLAPAALASHADAPSGAWRPMRHRPDQQGGGEGGSALEPPPTHTSLAAEFVYYIILYRSPPCAVYNSKNISYLQIDAHLLVEACDSLLHRAHYSVSSPPGPATFGKFGTGGMLFCGVRAPRHLRRRLSRPD